ncbi:MAG: hypothetical protein E7292_01535 [Lachnospiraceae bacterium]|nr:hypothetical protein [Lachnospiraceae bacterium]
MADKGKQDRFSEALVGKKIPILTLDNKWYRLLDEQGRAMAKEIEEELNAKLKRQGKLNTEMKEIKRLKKKMMNDIVSMVDEVSQTGNKKLEKDIEDNKRLIAECNEKLESYQEELIDLPREIDRLNMKLMLYTMEYCYDTMHDNAVQIGEIDEWVTQVRIELKKNLIRKQEMEYKNQEIYSYMNDIFGAEMMDLFDAAFLSEQTK